MRLAEGFGMNYSTNPFRYDYYDGRTLIGSAINLIIETAKYVMALISVARIIAVLAEAAPVAVTVTALLGLGGALVGSVI